MIFINSLAFPIVPKRKVKHIYVNFLTEINLGLTVDTYVIPNMLKGFRFLQKGFLVLTK